MKTNDLQIYINLGNECAVGLNDQDELVFFQTKQGVIQNYVPLGKHSPKLAEMVKETVDHLLIHMR